MAKTLTTHLRGSGMFSIDIVGESFYEDNLRSICGTHLDKAKRLQATLISEDDNPRDANAIRIEIEGLKVGYLDRGRAANLRAQLRRKGFDGIRATCDAKIVTRRGQLTSHVVVDSEGVELKNENIYGVKLDIVTSGEKRAAKKLDEVGYQKDLTFEPIPSKHGELASAYVGRSTKFWSPHDEPKTILIYASDTEWGQGKVGQVPRHLVPVFRRHMDFGLQPESRIIRLASGGCAIECRGLLTPGELSAKEQERAAKQERRHDELVESLAKPYRPKKPVQFLIDAPKGSLRKGSKLGVKTIPSPNEFLSAPHGSKIVFCSPKTGKEYDKTDDFEFQKKLVRLSLWCEEIEVHVIEARGPVSQRKEDGSGWVELTRYRCELFPRQSN